MFHPEDEVDQKIYDLMKEKGVIKNAYALNGEQKETDEIKCIRFFGKAPMLPGEEHHTCHKCGAKLHNLMQVYVPSLPPNFQRLLPPAIHGCLLVFYYCHQCGTWDFNPKNEDMVVSIYSPDQFEKLQLVNLELPENFPSAVVNDYTLIETANPEINEFRYLIDDLVETDETHMSKAKMSDKFFKVLSTLERIQMKSHFGGYHRVLNFNNSLPSPSWILFAELDENDWFEAGWSGSVLGQIFVHEYEPRFKVVFDQS